MIVQLLGAMALLLFATALASAIYVWTIVREVLKPPRGGMAYALSRRLPTTPEEMSLASRSFDVRCADGVVMPVWEVAREARALEASGDGATAPRIVLLHGWGRSRIDSLSRLGPFLVDGATVYLPDLRGHGDATRDARSRTTLGTKEVDDLARLVDALPPGPVVLVGHSMGGTLAIRVAASGTATERIAGVIAIAPYDTVVTPIAQRLETRDLPRGIFLAIAVGVLRRFGVETASTSEAASRLQVPLLVLQGERDRISPTAEAREIAAAGRGEFHALADVEHADHHLRQPEAFERSVREFLRRCLVSASAVLRHVPSGRSSPGGDPHRAEAQRP